MIVVDSSAAIHYLLRTDLAPFVEGHLRKAGRVPCAPQLLDAEVVAHLRRVELRGEADTARADLALRRFYQLNPRLYGVRPLIPRAWQMRANVSIYDGTYVALAEGLEAPLLTTDKRLARGAAAVSSATIIAPP